MRDSETQGEGKIPGWHGVVWCGMVGCGMAWCGVAWHGMAWHGMAWHGRVWCGVVSRVGHVVGGANVGWQNNGGLGRAPGRRGCWCCACLGLAPRL